MKSEYLLLVDRVINMNPAYIGKNDLSKLTKPQRKLLKECKKAILNPDSEIGLSNLRTEINYFIEKYDLYEIMTVKNSQAVNYVLEEVFWSYSGTLEYLLEMLLKHYPKFALEKKNIFEKYSPRLFSEIKKHEKKIINIPEPTNDNEKMTVTQPLYEKIETILFVAVARKLELFHHIDEKTPKERTEILINQLQTSSKFKKIKLKTELKHSTILRNVKRLLNENDVYFKNNEEKILEIIKFIESD